MQLPLNDSKQKILTGDCREVMKTLEANSIDCIVTDPPYGLSFMGKDWDKGVPNKEFWIEMLRVAKPGAMLLAFGGSRTYHRMACAIEDAGWEIRDCIMWIYGSGFPKSHNKFGFPGYGTALKPAHEPIIMAMKPLDGTFVQNAEKWGVAGLNIDGCRIGTTVETWPKSRSYQRREPGAFNKGIQYTGDSPSGRWPANVIFDEEAGALLDEQSGLSKSPLGMVTGQSRSSGIKGNIAGNHSSMTGHGDSGGASRFFYCAKASSAERNRDCEKNNHPTVKPQKLMEYLIKLVMPPKDGVLLDPFAGSGSTLVAAKTLDVNAIGIELSPEYVKIIEARIA